VLGQKLGVDPLETFPVLCFVAAPVLPVRGLVGFLIREDELDVEPAVPVIDQIEQVGVLL